MRHRLVPLLGAALLALAGCATQPAQPRVMHDRSVDFASYETFGWMPLADGVEAGSPRYESLLDRRIRQAVAAELESKGYRPADTAPDLLIAWASSSRERVRSSPFRVGVGVGGGSGHVGGSVYVGTPSVDQYMEGTLEIDVVDSKRGAAIWHGSLSSKAGGETPDDAQVRRVVRSILASFPAKPPR